MASLDDLDRRVRDLERNIAPQSPYDVDIQGGRVVRLRELSCTGRTDTDSLYARNIVVTEQATIPASLLYTFSTSPALLGRGSAGAGASEEITLGSGLTMTGTVLAVTAGMFQPLDADLTAIAALSGTGIAVKTAVTPTWTTRSIAGTSGRISVTNGDGVAGNPTVDLSTLADGGGGSFLKFTRDTYGRVSGTSAVAAGDITALVDATYVNVSGDTMTGQLASTYNSGAPFSVVSTTLVTNLNADRVDSYHADVNATATTIVARNGAGSIWTVDATLSGDLYTNGVAYPMYAAAAYPLDTDPNTLYGTKWGAMTFNGATAGNFPLAFSEVMSFGSNNTSFSGAIGFQLSHQYSSSSLYFYIRNRTSGGAWGAWRQLIHSGNIGSQTVSQANSLYNSTTTTYQSASNDQSGNTIAARAANGTITASGFVSTYTTGTAPMTVASTTVVTNLNADLLDGIQGAQYMRGMQWTSNIDANVDRAAGVWGSYASGATNTPTNSGILWHAVTGTITEDASQFWHEYGNNGLHMRHRWGGSWSAWTKIWTANNDGAGSGLDADTVDGVHVAVTTNRVCYASSGSQISASDIGWNATTSSWFFFNNAALGIRHLNGSDASTGNGDLYLNYARTNDVYIGGASGSAHLRMLTGNIYPYNAAGAYINGSGSGVQVVGQLQTTNHLTIANNSLLYLDGVEQHGFTLTGLDAGTAIDNYHTLPYGSTHVNGASAGSYPNTFTVAVGFPMQPTSVNGNNAYTGMQLAYLYTNDSVFYIRHKRYDTAGTWRAWRLLITSANIGSQVAGYANALYNANTGTYQNAEHNSVASKIVARDANGDIFARDLRSTGNLYVSTGNTSGGGIKLADDGDIVDLNDGYCSMRFSNGVRVFSANSGGSAMHNLAATGIAYHAGAVIVGSGGDAVCRSRHFKGKASGSDGDDTMYLQYDNGFGVTIGAGGGSTLAVNGNIYLTYNYGHTVVGVYSSTRYQGVWAMGDAYKLLADGTTPGTLYGLAWTHSNIGGQSKSGLGHQLLVMENGVTKTALGIGIWTDGNATITGSLSWGGYTQWAFVNQGANADPNGWYGGQVGSIGYNSGTQGNYPAAWTTLVSFGSPYSQGGIQIAATYGASNTYYIRNRTDQGPAWMGWVSLVHSGNIASQTVSNSDMVDGYHASGLGALRLGFSSNQGSGIANATGSLGGLEVYGGGGGNAAYMCFHRPGAFAAYFGLDGDNKWKVGGWSYGAVAHTIFHSGIDIIELGESMTGNRYSGIDFHGDDTNTDYAFRILRSNGGANAATSMNHKGTGLFSLGSDGAADIYIFNNSVETIRFFSDNDVSIGQTANAARLDVKGRVRIRNLSAGDTSGVLELYNNNGGLAYIFLDTNPYLICQNSTGGVYLTSGGTAWNAVSDERQKIIIEQISGAVDKVSRLRAVIGRYKFDDGAKRRPFLIAQDVMSILPEAVDDTNPDKLGMAYSDVIPLLTAAIKELAAEVESLKTIH